MPKLDQDVDFSKDQCQCQFGRQVRLEGWQQKGLMKEVFGIALPSVSTVL
jgi:hypothetical protein